TGGTKKCRFDTRLVGWQWPPPPAGSCSGSLFSTVVAPTPSAGSATVSRPATPGSTLPASTAWRSSTAPRATTPSSVATAATSRPTGAPTSTTASSGAATKSSTASTDRCSGGRGPVGPRPPFGPRPHPRRGRGLGRTTISGRPPLLQQTGVDDADRSTHDDAGHPDRRPPDADRRGGRRAGRRARAPAPELRLRNRDGH